MDVAPFRFMECTHLLELTGVQAFDLHSLLEGLRTVSSGAIFHHTHQYMLKAQIQTPVYPNDFARWAADGLEDRVLAEKLSDLDPFAFTSIEDVRQELIRIVEDYLEHYPPPRPVLAGREFFFNDARTVVLPTALEAVDLPSFREALLRVNVSSIYFHFFQAKLRLHRQADDFSLWFETSLGRPDLARRLQKIDPYMYSLEDLRLLIAAHVEAAMVQEE